MTVRHEPYGRDSATPFSARGARIDWSRKTTAQRLLGEALVRRLITERGSLLDDPTYGFALIDFLGDDFDAVKLAALPGLVRLELQKDERVDSVRVTARSVQVGATIEVTLEIQVEGVEVGPFDLVVRATELELSVLRLPEDS